jgi:hypothetical protein
VGNEHVRAAFTGKFTSRTQAGTAAGGLKIGGPSESSLQKMLCPAHVLILVYTGNLKYLLRGGRWPARVTETLIDDHWIDRNT